MTGRTTPGTPDEWVKRLAKLEGLQQASAQRRHDARDQRPPLVTRSKEDNAARLTEMATLAALIDSKGDDNVEESEALAEIREAGLELDDARRRLDDTIARALLLGVAVRPVADASGLSQGAVQRIANDKALLADVLIGMAETDPTAERMS